MLCEFLVIIVFCIFFDKLINWVLYLVIFINKFLYFFGFFCVFNRVLFDIVLNCIWNFFKVKYDLIIDVRFLSFFLVFIKFWFSFKFRSVLLVWILWFIFDVDFIVVSGFVVLVLINGEIFFVKGFVVFFL